MKPLEYSVYLLSRRDYSEKEIREKLKTRECPQNEIEDIINKLIEYKYLSNERFARSISKNKSIKFGDSAIKNILKTHNINDIDIENAMDDIDCEISRIKDIIVRKYYNKDLKDHEAKSKILRYLTSKQFGYNNIYYAINELIEESE